mgnify:CR=1 FL=1
MSEEPRVPDATWDDLAHELDRWAEAGRRASFWWRDDDAAEPTPALERLLGLARDAGVRPALAVIPARARPALAERLARENVAVVQHGWAHLNHASPGRPKAELGAERPAAYVLGELARGALVLGRLFGGVWLRVLVPPYNRVQPALALAVALAGYRGLSTYGARAQALLPGGAVQVNSHIDIIDWTTRAFTGEGPALGLALAHLRRRREARADPTEPTGLLTHHLAHDAGAWDFTRRFLERVGGHPAASWLAPEAAFAP